MVDEERTVNETRCDKPSTFRAGFVCFVGRPNVGKSTLMNALVGEKVAITSPQPQTTRRTIRGIVNRDNGQLIIVDTPGVHRPRKLLGERLNALTRSTLGSVDVIGLCIPAGELIGPGDRFINEILDDFPRVRKIAIVTRIDAVSRARVAEQLLAVSELREWEAILPVSAVKGYNLRELEQELITLLPVSAPLYSQESVTDETVEFRIAECIREAALEGVREELPHSLAVTVSELVSRDDRKLIEIYANIFVERDSQKPILIGRNGERLRAIGMKARASIEPIIGSQVFLSLRVKTAKDWQRDPKQLGRLGF